MRRAELHPLGTPLGLREAAPGLRTPVLSSSLGAQHGTGCTGGARTHPCQALWW